VYDGGAPIIGYSLDMKLKSEADPEKPTEGWKKIDTHGPLVITEFTIGQLDEKQEYDFKVSAKNQVGWGRHAYLKEPVFPKEVLGKNERPLKPAEDVPYIVLHNMETVTNANNLSINVFL